MTRPSAVAPPVRRMRHASATSGGEWRSATVTPDTPETEPTSAPVGGGKCAHTRRNKNHVYVIRTTRAALFREQYVVQPPNKMFMYAL